MFRQGRKYEHENMQDVFGNEYFFKCERTEHAKVRKLGVVFEAGTFRPEYLIEDVTDPVFFAS